MIGRTGKVKGGRKFDEEFQTPVFLTADNLKPFFPNDLDVNSKPIFFTDGDTQMIMELQKSHGALTQAIEHLTGAINQQCAKLDKIEEIRVDPREHTTRLSIACDDLKDTKKKVDRIHALLRLLTGSAPATGPAQPPPVPDPPIVSPPPPSPPIRLILRTA